MRMAPGGSYPSLHILVSSFVVQAARVLELGTGMGSNISFIANERGTEYFGIERNAESVAYVHSEWPELSGNVVCADFTHEMPFDGHFDLIVDRASVAHNDTDGIKRAIDIAYDALNPGGLFISADWFSIGHTEFQRGEVVDLNTRSGYTDGQFEGAGNVHFSSESELRWLFDKFERVHLQHREAVRTQPGIFLNHVVHRPWISPVFAGTDYRSSVWDIVCRKPS